MSGYNFTRSRVCGTVKALIPYSADIGAGGGSGSGFYGGGGGCGATYSFDGGPFVKVSKDGALSPKDYFEKQGYEVLQDHVGNGEAYDENMNVIASWRVPK
jgi:hypothetical protein